MSKFASLARPALALIASLGATGLAMAAERSKISPTIVPNFNQPDLSARNNAYTMTPEELKYDCKKLTGRVQIRIRQVRSTSVDTKTSALARGMQQAATPLLAGTTRGIDPEGDTARDLSMLKVFNARLVEKKCQPFDLEAELKPGATNDPHPIPKPKAAGTGLHQAARPAVPEKASAPAAAAVPAPAKAP